MNVSKNFLIRWKQIQEKVHQFSWKFIKNVIQLKRQSNFYFHFIHMNSLGGVVLANMDFTIVTSNTFKSKLDLSFAAFIPDIRANLFPSLRR